jgi:hypothetical protein
LASQPELKSRADGALKNEARRASRVECAVVEPESNREPVDPKMLADILSRCR